MLPDPGLVGNVFLAEQKSLASDALLSLNINTSTLPDPTFASLTSSLSSFQPKISAYPPLSISMDGSNELIESRFSKQAGDMQSRTVTWTGVRRKESLF